MSDNKTEHTANLKRLKRIEGQVRGIQRMIEKREYCIDIINQVQAVRSALQSVSLQILRKHIKHCVNETLEAGNEDAINEKTTELLNIIKRMEK